MRSCRSYCRVGRNSSAGIQGTTASFPGHLATPREEQSTNKFAGVDTIACAAQLNFRASIFIQNTTPVCNLQQVSHSIFQVILRLLALASFFQPLRICSRSYSFRLLSEIRSAPQRMCASVWHRVCTDDHCYWRTHGAVKAG